MAMPGDDVQPTHYISSSLEDQVMAIGTIASGAMTPPMSEGTELKKPCPTAEWSNIRSELDLEYRHGP